MMQRRTFMSMAAATGASLGTSLLGEARDWSLPPIVKYPDPAVEVVQPSFAKYKPVNAAVEWLWTGARWAEGPA